MTDQQWFCAPDPVIGLKAVQANDLPAGGYYYNGDSRFTAAERTVWCNTRHPNEARATQLPATGPVDPVVTAALFLVFVWVFVGILFWLRDHDRI